MLAGNRGTAASTSRPCSELPRLLQAEGYGSELLRRQSCGAFSKRTHRLQCQAATLESGTSNPAQSARVQENRIPASNILIQPQPDILLAGGHNVEEAALEACVQHHIQHPRGLQINMGHGSRALSDAYKRCGDITQMYAKTFYLGTQLMTPEKARAIWAIYVWCRRTDELVDGPNASRITPMALDRWQERLEATFDGKPYDILDAALTETVSRFPVAIQPFRDMIEGMRMDLVKPRYQTFDELYEYCYRVAGTVGLMSTPVMGIDPSYKGELKPVYKAALALGTANQLTNILRDVGEDAVERDRIYVPLDDLSKFGISEREVTEGLMFAAHNGQIDDRWQAFMRFQIARARQYFADAEAGVGDLDRDARWPVWSALILYRQILDSIEANGFNNFTKRAYVPKWRKLASLPAAFVRANMPVIMQQKGQQQQAQISQ